MSEIDVVNPQLRGYRKPPCQTPDCEGPSHFRSGYVDCLTHDHVEVPLSVADPELTEIATDDFRFFFGAS